ncbi:hypothetical protein AWT69_003518 [Pseudomonas putida]|nr:hypothetical protein AWT69_003518 [Pseudomonas putida]
MVLLGQSVVRQLELLLISVARPVVEVLMELIWRWRQGLVL